MAKWNVYGNVVGSKYLGEFEADTAEDAVDMALSSDASWVKICHQCAHEIEDPEIFQGSAERVER